MPARASVSSRRASRSSNRDRERHVTTNPIAAHLGISLGERLAALALYAAGGQVQGFFSRGYNNFII